MLPGDEFREFSNDSQGVNELVKQLKACHVELIVMEATGGYEVDVAAALAAAGLPIVMAYLRAILAIVDLCFATKVLSSEVRIVW